MSDGVYFLAFGSVTGRKLRGIMLLKLLRSITGAVWNNKIARAKVSRFNSLYRITPMESLGAGLSSGEE